MSSDSEDCYALRKVSNAAGEKIPSAFEAMERVVAEQEVVATYPASF